MARSIINVTKNILGTSVGMLSLPSGVAAGTGIVPAICLTVLLGMHSGWTFSLFGRACESTGASDIRGLGRLAASGHRLARAMDWVCTLRTSFACLAFSIVMADSFTAILSSAGLPVARNVALGALSALVLLPLCCLRDLSALAYTSLLGPQISRNLLYNGVHRAPILRRLVRCRRQVLRGGRRRGVRRGARRPLGGDPEHVGAGLRAVHRDLRALQRAEVLEPAQESRSVGRFNRVVSVSFGIAVVLCVTAMSAGFLTFGAQTRGNVLNNYSTSDPLATIARLSVACSVVCTYPLAFTGLRDGVMSLLEVTSSRRNHLLTTLILLSRGSKPLPGGQVAFVVNLGGAIFGALIVYIFPSVLFLRTTPRASGAERRAARATVCAGVLLAVAGTAVAVVQEFAPRRLR
ncbi:unnamed protein product [Prorocentrum cordatum]|uniref:Amino acid transporter transmembrane domain-containing protein n=1 Tax=Prorocentrum cordatum TaxID=2364126 RepID=A0ABN9TC99_9DINO|nr:unnamed protein product [Polarella glacialis]